jgi:hypothetical protein
MGTKRYPAEINITCFIRYQIDPFQREAYRARIGADAEGRANFAHAREKRFIIREERTFLENVDAP